MRNLNFVSSLSEIGGNMKKMYLTPLIFLMSLCITFQSLAAWEADIQLSRESSQPKVTIGVGETEVRLDAPPLPPEYWSTLIINRFPVSDWESSLAKLIQVAGQETYCWGLSANPHGNQGPPFDLTAVLSWNFSDIPGQFELRKGYDCQGEIVVADMKLTTELQITGQNTDYYFTVNYTPSSVDPPTTYIIEATSDANGTINPTGTQTILAGIDAAFNIQPDSGYEIKDVLIDGVSMGPISSYTFNDVSSAHSIHAAFKSILPQIQSVTPSSCDIEGNETITVTGKNFKSSIRIFVDDNEVNNVNIVSDTTLTFLSPAHSAGLVEIKILNADNVWSEQTGSLRYTDPGNVTGIWEAIIEAIRGASNPKVSIGEGEIEEFVDAPPDPPEFETSLKIIQFQFSDWNTFYQRWIQGFDNSTKCFEIAFNPRGNMGPPVGTALLKWDFSHVQGTFKLKESYGCNGNTIIADMHEVTEYSVTGNGDQYFSIVYTPGNPPFDTTPPEIQLNGEAEIIVVQGDAYNDAGALATDDTDGDITDKIAVNNPVNTQIPDTYVITYNVSDAAGNAASEVTRTVKVVARPVITLLGDAEVIVEKCTEYTDAGATASDGNLDISSQIAKTEHIDLATPGMYTVLYEVTSSNGIAALPVTRKVVVKDTIAPVITLKGENSITINLKDDYTEPGFTAIDPNCNSDMSNEVNVVFDDLNTEIAGNYSICYQATDASGNTSERICRQIVVIDPNQPPVIELIGNTVISVLKGDTYNDPGASASDDFDGDISEQITVDNPVNTQIPGTYIITYNVSDSGGLAAVEVTRTVKVTQPTISIEPSEIHFGEVPISQASIQMLSILNEGNDALSIETVSVSGQHADYFSIESDTCSGMTLSNAQSCTVNIQFSPTCTSELDSFAYIDIKSSDTAIPVYSVSVDGQKGNYYAEPVHTNNVMEIYGKILDGNNQPIPDGTEIAAFVYDGNNDLLLVGHDHFQNGEYGFMSVYGDDQQTDEKDGAEDDDTLIFKVFMADTCTEYTLSLIDGSNVWDADVSNKSADWKVIITQKIPLKSGWNLFSLNLNKCWYIGEKPSVPMLANIEFVEVNSIGDILSSIDGQYSYVKGFDGTAKTYNLSDRYSNMKYMAAGYGYWIKINEDAHFDEKGLIYLTIQGTAIFSDTAIQLQEGWNISGYIGNEVRYIGEKPDDIPFIEPVVYQEMVSGNVDDIFQTISGQYTYIRAFDKNGFQPYDPSLPDLSRLKYVGPGYGYCIKIKAGETATLKWNPESTENVE